MSGGPEPFFSSAGFAEILKAAGLGEMDMDAFRMLEEARQRVLNGDMAQEEYDTLAKGVQLQLLMLAAGSTPRALPAPMLAGRSDKAPEKIEVPVNEKPIVESWLMKQPITLLNPLNRQFKRRYVVLYKSCIVYYANQGDKVPKGRVDLTPDFFVQDSVAHPNGFVISDMATTITLAAETEDLKNYWTHLCAMVLRKLGEQDSSKTAEDESTQIKKAFEERLSQYKAAKGNRRTSLFFPRKKKEEDEKAMHAAKEAAMAETAKDMREKEMQRQAQLEALQRRLDEAEAEKNKYKTEAEMEHERAETQSKRALEEEGKRVEVEARLQKTLDELRVESRMREEALREEQREVQVKLDAANNRRRQSMMPGVQVANGEFEAWEKERKALQAKLDALQDALNVDLGSLEWDGTLEDAEAKMKELVPALCSENEAEAREAQAVFDQWDKIIRNHAEYKAREEQKWVQWEEDNAPVNRKALADMKRIVPHEVTTGVSQDFLVEQCHLSPEVAQRIMKTKILQFYYMDTDVIAKVHIADLSSRYVPQGLDIRELRAVYACLPKEFQLDSDGRKKLWRDECRTKLAAMIEKEKSGSLPKNELLAAAYRPKEEKKAGVAGGGGGGGGKKLDAGALGAMLAGRGAGPPAAPKLDTSALQNALASKLAGGLPKPPADKQDMLARSAELAAKADKEREAQDLLSIVKKSHKPAEPAAAAASPQPNPVIESLAAAAPAKAPPEAAARKASNLPVPGSSAKDRKVSFLQEKSPDAGSAAPAHAEDKRAAPPPMVDLGIKFNAKPSEPPQPKDNSLLSADTREMFNKAAHRSRTLTQDEFEGEVSAYDFEANYAAASKKKVWVDDGIQKLTDVILAHGTFDKGEGGQKTLAFGKIFEKYGEGSDMIVGILMRGRKKGKFRYVGDMLFVGTHDHVKITVL